MGVVIFVVVCTRQNMNHFDEDECVIVMFLFSDSILNRSFHGKKVDNWTSCVLEVNFL